MDWVLRRYTRNPTTYTTRTSGSHTFMMSAITSQLRLRVLGLAVPSEAALARPPQFARPTRLVTHAAATVATAATSSGLAHDGLAPAQAVVCRPVPLAAVRVVPALALVHLQEHALTSAASGTPSANRRRTSISRLWPLSVARTMRASSLSTHGPSWTTMLTGKCWLSFRYALTRAVPSTGSLCSHPSRLLVNNPNSLGQASYAKGYSCKIG